MRNETVYRLTPKGVIAAWLMKRNVPGESELSQEILDVLFRNANLNCEQNDIPAIVFPRGRPAEWASVGSN
jgi:hypothetical protein